MEATRVSSLATQADSVTASKPSAPLDRQVDQLRELTRARRHHEALAVAAALEAAASIDREVLLLTAVNQRCLDRVSEALATLERLEQGHPRFSRLYAERGHCHLRLGDVPRAICAFQQSVTLNEALLESWNMLVQLSSVRGDRDAAMSATAHVSILRRLPAEIVRAASLFSDGELSDAERILRSHLRVHGAHVEALRLLGRIALERGALDDAERHLRSALAIAPHYRAARADFARALIAGQCHERARAEIAALLELDPGNPAYLLLHATVAAGLGQHEQAISLYRAQLARNPEWAQLHLLLGHSLKAIGRAHDAVECYRTAATVRASFGDAYWSLADLKTYRFSPEEIERMRSAERAPTTQRTDRYPLCFALGRALEDRAEYAESWQYYERGNALKLAESRYRAEFTEINTRRQIEVCSAPFFAARVGVGMKAHDPIFIVGLPRAGSTLIEQILASHTQVDGTQELFHVPRIALELQGREPDALDPRYPAALAALAPQEFQRLGARYLADTRVYRGRAPFFIDKMPNNFRHVGLIHLMLPNARIIDVRREPMACCFSNLRQLFASGQDFTYSIENIARYYRTYLELMKHWNAVLPGRVLRVQYEDVVEDLAGSVRRMLEYCELDYESRCLDFHATVRSISTASSEQVRQPLFREGLARWQNYAASLAALERALGDALARYRE